MLSKIGSTPQFAGTGANGKPRVVIAKASYALGAVETFRNSDAVEIKGTATTPHDFADLLRVEKPDVVVIGKTFGSKFMLSPLDIVKMLYQSETRPAGKPPGVVVLSFEAPDNHHLESYQLFAPEPKPLYEYVSAKDTERDSKLLAAIRKVDPSPPAL